MYITKTIKEILDEGFEKYKDYKLCYIDDIETTYSDWDEESQAIINSPNFSWEKEHEMFGYNSPRLNLKDYPNPDYIEEKQEKYAYFTPISLDKQWGDDWNDTPFEHNAGIPYDNDYNDRNNRIEITIIKIPFYLDYHAKYAGDWGYNSPFSVQEINRGVVAWIYLESKKDYDTIFAGDSIEKFIKTILLWIDKE